jgi:hypothetical protein
LEERIVNSEEEVMKVMDEGLGVLLMLGDYKIIFAISETSHF